MTRRTDTPMVTWLIGIAVVLLWAASGGVTQAAFGAIIGWRRLGPSYFIYPP
jgi:hypothetical protein